jgi:hypothetical protein
MLTVWTDNLAVLLYGWDDDLPFPVTADHPGLDPVPQEPASD